MSPVVELHINLFPSRPKKSWVIVGLPQHQSLPTIWLSNKSLLSLCYQSGWSHPRRPLVSLTSSTSCAIAAALPPNEECGCTKTVFQTVTETETKILCETSSTSIVQSPASTSTSSEITTIIVTSTTTTTSTLKQSTVTQTVEPSTSDQSQPATSETLLPTGLPSGSPESQKPVSYSTVAPFTTTTTNTTTIYPTPPYANSTTILMSTSRSNYSSITTSRGGGTLIPCTRIGTFDSCSSFSRTTNGSEHSTTLQTVFPSRTKSVTTQSFDTVPASSSQTTNLPTSSGDTLPSPTTVGDNSGVFTNSPVSSASPSSTASVGCSTTTPYTPHPSKPSVYKMNKRHHGGGENSQEGEGYWGNARRVWSLWCFFGFFVFWYEWHVGIERETMDGIMTLVGIWSLVPLLCVMDVDCCFSVFLSSGEEIGSPKYTDCLSVCWVVAIEGLSAPKQFPTFICTWK